MSSAGCASVRVVLDGDWSDCAAEERQTTASHLRNCPGCRQLAVSEDPLWVFRLAEIGRSDSAVGGLGSDASLDLAVEVEQMQQRVRGAIRARAMEGSEAAGPGESSVATAPASPGVADVDGRRRLSRVLAAAGLVAAALGALTVSQRPPTDPGLAARAEMARHLESMPVLGDGWASGGAEALSSASGSSGAPGELPGVSRVLAHLSDRDADVVWVVNAALEL